MKEINCKKDEVIFREGEFGSVMYDIVSGKIGIFSGYQSEKEKQIAELGAGQIFGEMGMIEIYPRSATAVSLEEGTVLRELGESELNDYLKDKPEKLLLLMKQLSHRIRETTQAYVDVCRTVSERRRAEKEENTKARLRYQQELNNYASLYSTFWK
ncbi:MAG: cyclic nucleotide-binding domain-containing protein [Oscillospiraceae bacterium]|nr:cyclic nucleotide-binding domain-containing protein [Oscillospiraceae bacterium]